MTSPDKEAFAFETFTQDSHALDSHVGDRIRRLRSLSGIGINELARMTGVTVLRMQHYEFGESRMTAEHLRRICSVLNVPASFFFERVALRVDA